jgi:Kef-type K+ transport system membrane component KefB
MESTLIIGLIIFTGLLFGELAKVVKLPKITGYIVAGICLNPQWFHFIPQDFTEHTNLVTNISLSFITFSVGGTLLYSRLKTLGKTILYITIFEAEFALLAVITGFLLLSFIPGNHFPPVLAGMLIPFSILLGTLASPTDPSATLAVIHEYKVQGDVSSTILGVAAFDDAFGIINYSIGVSLASVLISHEGFNVYSSILDPTIVVIGGITLGVIFGLALNLMTKVLNKETEGALIVSVFAMLTLCYGTAMQIGVDELLATMIMGCIVVNYNPIQEKIFRILERYTEELIFVLFFTLSGMHLKFSALSGSLFFIGCFVVFRSIGKTAGAILGSSLSRASSTVKRYAFWGLIPQGGIVIGLALMIKANPVFANIADSLIGIIIGATIIHELIGPLLSKIALRKAGEISND